MKSKLKEKTLETLKPSQKILIKKLNKRFSNLTTKSDNHFETKKTISKKNIEKAFKTTSDPSGIIVTYEDFIAEFEASVKTLRKKFQNNFNETQTFKLELNSFEKEHKQLIENYRTIKNFDSFYQLSIKNDLIELAKQIIVEKEHQRSDKLEKKYFEKLEELEKRIKSSYLEVESNKKDYRHLIETSPIQKSFYQRDWKIIIIISMLGVLAIVLILVLIWKMIII